MEWDKGYSASFYASVLDADAWCEVDRIEITDGRIARSTADLQESAEIGCVDYDQSTERWIRINMDVEQDGQAAHIPLFTGLAAAPGRDINGRLITNRVECYSVLKPAQDILLPRGWFAPKGRRAADLIESLLKITPAPTVVTQSSPELPAYIVAEAGESHLSMVIKILNAVGWRLRIEGDGTIGIMPQANNISVTFSTQENDCVEPRITTKFDWYDCPNVYRAISGDKCVEVTDEDAIRERGRQIWLEDASPAFNGSESIEMYAQRKLREARYAAYTVNYDRRYHPDIKVGDIVELHYPEINIDNIFRVVTQSISLNNNARTSERAERYEQV